MRSPTTEPGGSRLARPAARLAVAAAFVAPVALMVLGSLRRPGLPPPRGAEVLPPGGPSLEAYRDAFSLVPLGRSLLNSLVVCAVAVPLSVVVASWAGLAIAQARGRRRALLAGVTLLLFMVPATALWLARFALFEAAGAVDTYGPLIAPALLGGSPLFVLLYALAFRRVPADLFEAARLEGASPLRTWRRVAMPLARPTTAAVALLSFALFWSSFLDPLLYLRSESLQTAPLALRSLGTLGPTRYSTLLAAATVVVVPAVAALALARRWFLSDERGAGWLGR